jgi:hypothetical protein
MDRTCKIDSSSRNKSYLLRQKSVLAFPTAAVVALFNRPWWQRIWVVQEVVLAKNVYLICGNIDMLFSLLSLAFTLLYELPMPSAYAGGALETRIAALTPIFSCNPRLLQAAARGNGQDRQILIERLDEVHSLQTTEMKDHIYALLGIVSDIDRLGIKVDYSKPCAEMFIQIAEGLLVKQVNMQILSRCQMPKEAEGALVVLIG